MAFAVLKPSGFRSKEQREREREKKKKKGRDSSESQTTTEGEEDVRGEDHVSDTDDNEHYVDYKENGYHPVHIG